MAACNDYLQYGFIGQSPTGGVQPKPHGLQQYVNIIWSRTEAQFIAMCLKVKIYLPFKVTRSVISEYHP